MRQRVQVQHTGASSPGTAPCPQDTERRTRHGLDLEHIVPPAPSPYITTAWSVWACIVNTAKHTSLQRADVYRTHRKAHTYTLHTLCVAGTARIVHMAWVRPRDIESVSKHRKHLRALSAAHEGRKSCGAFSCWPKGTACEKSRNKHRWPSLLCGIHHFFLHVKCT